LCASPVKASGAKSLLSVADIWASAEFIEGGVLSQTGFAALCDKLKVEQMSFEAVYLLFTLSPEIEDVMVVCASKVAFQRGIECLGCGLLVFVGIASCLLAVVRVAALSSHAATNMNACRCKTLADLPVKLRLTRLALQSDYSERFHPFFVWLFDMGKNIAAMNSGACVSVVRSVPLLVGLQLMEAVLGSWPLFPKLKDFCEQQFMQPFSKDMWTQIGRFVEMTTSGQIHKDLGNYDDDLTGGGSAWPCMIDDFVEYVQNSQ